METKLQNMNLMERWPHTTNGTEYTLFKQWYDRAYHI